MTVKDIHIKEPGVGGERQPQRHVETGDGQISSGSVFSFSSHQRWLPSLRHGSLSNATLHMADSPLPP